MQVHLNLPHNNTLHVNVFINLQNLVVSNGHTDLRSAFVWRRSFERWCWPISAQASQGTSDWLQPIQTEHMLLMFRPSDISWWTCSIGNQNGRQAPKLIVLSTASQFDYWRLFTPNCSSLQTNVSPPTAESGVLFLHHPTAFQHGQVSLWYGVLWWH